VFARWVKTGGKVGLLIATDVLLQTKDENGRLCPSPEEARDGRPIVWFFDSKIVKDFVQNIFKDEFPDIQFVWLPMPRDKK
jgi:hypothetical protein